MMASQAELIKKALAGFQSEYCDPWEMIPTSVELDEQKGVARIWFEFPEEIDEGHMTFAWQFSLSVPMYWFWGKKKKDKYLKAQKKEREERLKKGR